MKKTLFFLVFTVFFSGCIPPSSDMIQTAIAKTASAVYETITPNPSITPLPTETVTPTEISYKRNNLGVEVIKVIRYFNKLGVYFEAHNYEDGVTKYIGEYDNAHLIFLDDKDGILTKANMMVFLDTMERDDNAPGLGDLPAAIYGYEFYDVFIKPWLMSETLSNDDNLCLDEIVFDFTDLSKTPAKDWTISLSIHPEVECSSLIFGCCNS